MTIFELIDALISQRETAIVLVKHDKFKYACNSLSRNDKQLILMLSASPGDVAELIDDLRMFSNVGDLDVMFVAEFSYLDKDKKLVPIMGVENDSHHVFLMTEGYRGRQ